MRNLEELFVREFKQSVSTVGYKDIYKIPVPQECEKWSVSGSDLFAVKGIDAEYYNRLNKTIVKRLPRGYVAKRRVIDKATRNFKIDEEGKFVYEDYTVPSGSIVVTSGVKISLPFKDYNSKEKSPYGYIDFVNEKDGQVYMYVLPMSVLYRVHQTALAISVTNMKNYRGMGYRTWNNGTIFVHIIPYRPNSQYIGSRILATKYSLDYNTEIETLLKYWQQVGVIPDLALTSLSDNSNLALVQTAVGYNEFIPVDSIAMSDKEIYGALDNIEE